jgi:hypothetical protein
MSKPTKKREAPISYRPPERLRDEFHTRVKNSGLSISAFITTTVFGQAAPRQKRSATVDQKLAVQLLSRAARINDRLSQNANPADPYHSLILEECRDDLAEIRTCLLAALGRDP